MAQSNPELAAQAEAAERKAREAEAPSEESGDYEEAYADDDGGEN